MRGVEVQGPDVSAVNVQRQRSTRVHRDRNVAQREETTQKTTGCTRGYWKHKNTHETEQSGAVRRQD